MGGGGTRETAAGPAQVVPTLSEFTFIHGRISMTNRKPKKVPGPPGSTDSATWQQRFPTDGTMTESGRPTDLKDKIIQTPMSQMALRPHQQPTSRRCPSSGTSFADLDATHGYLCFPVLFRNTLHMGGWNLSRWSRFLREACEAKSKPNQSKPAGEFQDFSRDQDQDLSASVARARDHQGSAGIVACSRSPGHLRGQLFLVHPRVPSML